MCPFRCRALVELKTEDLNKSRVLLFGVGMQACSVQLVVLCPPVLTRFELRTVSNEGWDSVVSIATNNELDGPESEFR